MRRWVSIFLQIGIVKLKKESEIERGALNGYCEIEKGKKIKTKKKTLEICTCNDVGGELRTLDEWIL